MTSRFSFALLLIWFYALAPATRGAATEPTVEGLLQTAFAAHNDSEFEEAERIYGEVLRRDPEHAVALLNRAKVRASLEKWSGAEADLDMCLSLEPRATEAFRLRAYLRLQRGNFDGAIADASVAIRLEDAAELRSLRGRALVWKGDYEAALEDLEAALQADEEDDEARFARGTALLQLGRVGDAYDDFSLLAAEHPGHAAILSGLGRTCFYRLELEEAEEVFERLVELDTTDPGSWRLLGYTRLAVGKNAEAIAALERSLKEDEVVSPWSLAALHVAWKRAKRDGESPLAARVGQVEDPWGKVVGETLLGRRTEDALIEEADAGATPDERAGRLCEAYYYLGAMRLLAQDKVAARAMFTQAMATRRTLFIEYTLAASELRKMERR